MGGIYAISVQNGSCVDMHYLFGVDLWVKM